MVQRNVGVLQANFRDHIFPELEGFQHVGFVYAGDTPLGACRLALARRLECHMGNALNLRAAVAHGVKSLFGAREMPIQRNAAAPRLAEIDVTSQFADDQNVQTCNQFRFQARGTHQLFVTNGRAEIGKQSKVFAQAQNRLFGAQWAVKFVVLPVTHGTKQHGIGCFGQSQGGFRQGVAVRFIRGTAYQCGFHLQVQIQGAQHLDRFGNDFSANPVTGQYCNFHGFYSYLICSCLCSKSMG